MKIEPIWPPVCVGIPPVGSRGLIIGHVLSSSADALSVDPILKVPDPIILDPDRIQRDVDSLRRYKTPAD